MPAKKLHIKPTNEELDANIQKSIDELEKPETPIPPQEEAQPPQETPQIDEKPDESPQEEGNDNEEENKELKEETKPDPTDYKKRYEDSSTEAHILYSKNKKMTEAIEKASEVADPTEEELLSEYPEWEIMSDFEKKMAKKDLINSRKLDAISNVAKDFKDMDAWNNKVDEFLADPATFTDHPGLEGKEDDFKIFVSKETRRGVDFPDLVASFLFTASQKPKNKGAMFETGSAGSKDKPKAKGDTITTEESVLLRQTNYKEYIRLLRLGKIEAPKN